MTNYSKLNNYINFTDKYEMNEHVTAHRQAHCYDLNETDKSLLTYISRYACRYVGVAYLKVSTMCKFLDKSTRTIRRSLNALQSLGIIKRIKTTRILGGQGANIIQIQQYVTPNMSPSIEVLEPCESKAQATNEETKPFYSQNKNIINIKTSTKDSKSSVSKDNLYNRLKTLVQARKGSLNGFRALIGVIYGKLKKLKTDASTALTHAQIEAVMYQSLDALLNKSNVTNELAMLNSIIKNKVNDLLQKVSAPIATIARTEHVPDWFDTRNDDNTSNSSNTVCADSDAPAVDFEAERAKVLAKLGY